MTDLTRRTVIGAGATGLAAGVAAGALEPAAAAPATPAAVRFTRTEGLYRRTRFARRRGLSFTATGSGVRIGLKLVKVADIPGAGRGSARSFELTFTAPRKGPEQGTYTLTRTGFSATSLFLVPSDAGRRTYRAVVNNR